MRSQRSSVTNPFPLSPMQQPVVRKPWLTATEVAAYAAVSVQTVYDACAVGSLKCSRVEGRRSIRIKPEWVDEWMMQFVVEIR